MECLLKPILKRIQEQLIGLDDAQRRLTTIIESFAKSHEGGSCMVVGPRRSGKTTLIKNVLPLIPREIDTKRINGLLWTEAKAIKLLEQADSGDDSAKFIVIDNVEHFLAKSNQNLIYKVLDATRTRPWYVIFVTARQDFDEMLEKRVRSRLSNIVVKCVPRIELKDFHSAFVAFVSGDKKTADWNGLIKDLMKSRRVLNRLEALYEERCSYSALKDAASLFLSYIIAAKLDIDQLTVETLEEILIAAVKTVVPDDRSFMTALEGLSLRQLCLLICVRKLDSYARGGRHAHSYQQIVRRYLKLVNDFYSVLKVQNVLTLYKDLDHLAVLGFLTITTDGQAQMSFKRVRLTFDNELFDEFQKEVKVPTSVRYWIDDLSVKE